ncbi:MAG: DUF1616 domain-containing protein [Dehalococcoidia bacterium]
MYLIRIAILTALLSPIVALMATFGIWRRRRVPAERSRMSIRIPRWAGLTNLGRLITAGGLIAVVSTVTGIIILLLGQKSNNDRFTEFYLLGVDGTADGYPAALSVGETAYLTLGIVNQEGQETDYSVALFIDGALTDRITGVRLKPRERLQRPLTFTLTEGGENQSVEFVLYRDGHSRPYHTLRLRVDGQETLTAPEATESVLAETEGPAPASEEAPPPERSAPQPTGKPTPAPRYEVHTVSRGENLTLISRRYGTPLESVIRANESEIPDPNLIYPSQRIRIPRGAR